MMNGPCFYCESDAHASSDCPHTRPGDPPPPPMSRGGGAGGWRKKAEKTYDLQQQQRNYDAASPGSVLHQAQGTFGVASGGGSSSSALSTLVRQAAASLVAGKQMEGHVTSASDVGRSTLSIPDSILQRVRLGAVADMLEELSIWIPSPAGGDCFLRDATVLTSAVMGGGQRSMDEVTHLARVGCGHEPILHDVAVMLQPPPPPPQQQQQQIQLPGAAASQVKDSKWKVLREARAGEPPAT